MLLPLSEISDADSLLRCLPANSGCDEPRVGRAPRRRDIVRQQLAANSQYLVIWGKDSEFAYYNSKVAPRCPGVQDRDVIREAVEAAAAVLEPLDAALGQHLDAGLGGGVTVAISARVARGCRVSGSAIVDGAATDGAPHALNTRHNKLSAKI